MSQLNLHRGPLTKSYRCPGRADRCTHTSSKVIWHKLPESHHFLPHSERDLRLIPLTGSWTSNTIFQEPMGPWDAPIYAAIGPSPPAQINHANIHRWEGDTDNTFMHIYATGLIRPSGDDDCAQNSLIVFYLIGDKTGKLKGGLSKEPKVEWKWNHLSLEF